MTFKSTVQNIYNSIRNKAPFADIANFFISREREFINCENEAIEKALGQVERNEEGRYLVTGGPFSGMLWEMAYKIGSEFPPKLMGTYELELKPTIDRWLSDEMTSSFIDIGAAEGYYAVGVALRSTEFPIFAYEIQADAHEHIRRLARLNKVLDRIHLFGEFRPKDLDKVNLGDCPIVLMDVDGFEEYLIDEVFLSHTANARMILEIHDFVKPGLGDLVAQRLKKSHKINRVYPNASMRRNVQKPFEITKFEWSRAVDERRPKGNYWLICEPIIEVS